jgi:hypothetical protein
VERFAGGGAEIGCGVGRSRAIARGVARTIVTTVRSTETASGRSLRGLSVNRKKYATTRWTSSEIANAISSTRRIRVICMAHHSLQKTKDAPFRERLVPGSR